MRLGLIGKAIMNPSSPDLRGLWAGETGRRGDHPDGSRREQIARTGR